MKFTRQFDQMDCGPACIRMVASAYGKDYPLSYLRKFVWMNGGKKIYTLYWLNHKAIL